MILLGPCCLLFASILVCCWSPADSYANGKVSKVCGSMMPHHHTQGQTSDSPYSLQTNATSFTPTDQIEVILSGTTHFEGFLLQARDAAGQDSAPAIGTFHLTDPKHTQLLKCNKDKNSAVSHTSAAKQTVVTVIWIPPADAPAQVQFFVTVVAHYDTFWVKLPGPVISQHGFTPRPPQPHTTADPSLTTTASTPPKPFTSEGCGQWKSCLLDPPGCDPIDDPQCFYLSMATEGQGQTVVKFELSGPSEGYISFALSWDTWMGNDDVYMCVKDGDQVSVSAAYVRGRTHPEDESQSDLSSVSWRLADGVIQCRFSRPVKLTNQEAARFDLDQEYFLFLASGAAQHGFIRRHQQQPAISTRRINITGPPDILSSSRSPVIMKMHGALMLLAWMLTGSVGTFIASFYKPDWPNHTLFGQRIWFQVHRGLMILTVTLTAVAFSLPFFYRKGWSKRAGVHPYLGCCVLGLSLIQPIMAVVRPSPDSNRRCIFNWAHWAVGYTTEILAVVAMFLGMNQSSLYLPQPHATHVLIGYVTWLASFRALLLIHKHFYIRKPAAEPSDTQGIFQSQTQQSLWGSFAKSVMLAFLALGNAGFLVALFSFIAAV